MTGTNGGTQAGAQTENEGADTRTLLGTGTLNYNSRAWRTSVPKEGVEDDPIFSEDQAVAFFKEGDGRIVIEPREQPVPAGGR